MHFVMLWITMGLGVLVVCGLQETIAYLGIDAGFEGPDDRGHTMMVALCLTLLVLCWPMVLLEMVKGKP